MVEYTATGYIFTPSKDKILLIYHKKFDRWLPPGGHIDLVNEAPHEGLVRKIKAEIGIEPTFIDQSHELKINDEHTKLLPTPSFIGKYEIPPYENKSKKYFVDHIYILQAKETDKLSLSKNIDEAAWVEVKNINQIDTWEIVKKVINRFSQRKNT